MASERQILKQEVQHEESQAGHPHFPSWKITE